ncbi:MAG: hypothetical protein RL217_566, partial [Pseudomonadota bacterium]
LAAFLFLDFGLLIAKPSTNIDFVIKLAKNGGFMNNSLAHSPAVEAFPSPQLNSAQLQQAFLYFNEMSQQLTDSYSKLEDRVIQLSGELAQVAQKRMQELAEKERLADRLESLLQILPAGVLILDQYGYVRQSNAAADELLLPLVGAKTLIKQRWRTLIQTCFQPRQDDGHEISLVNGKRVHLRTAPMAETGQLILLTDMTETRDLQARLSQHERLSAMGKMVASLAHQIRTPLAAATLYAGHLVTPELDESMRLRCAEKLQERLRHLESQIRDMLIFARGETSLSDQVSLATLQQNWLAALEVPLNNQHARCQVVNALPDREIHCNQDVLISALMNLVNNALEACPLGAAEIALEFEVLDGERVAIWVKDNGTGLSGAQKEKIQQPFYTTKANGTGLGLAVVQAVARAHHAQVLIRDNPPSGLAVAIVLPLIAQS